MHKSFFKGLIITHALHLFCWVVFGIIVAVVGLTVYKFDSISPPQLLSSYLQFEFVIRLFDSTVVNRSSVLILLAVILFIVLGYVVYCIKKIKTSSWKIAVVWICTGLVTSSVLLVAFMMCIPGPVIWGIYKIKASFDLASARQELKQSVILYDPKEIISQIKSNQKIHIFADYDSAGGALLATEIGGDKYGKLNHYQSFYLPIFFSDNKILTGNRKIDDAPVMLMGNNLIFSKYVQRDMVYSFLPAVGNNIVTRNYGEYVLKSPNTLKTFTMIDDANFVKYYHMKISADLERFISEDEAAYKNNSKIIADYPATRAQLDADDKKFVADEEADYQNNCVKYPRYNNCSELRSTIDKNIIINRDNRIQIEASYAEAIRLNKIIQGYLNKSYAEKKANENNSDSLENNKGEYAYALTFAGDTIYYRYFDKHPMGEDNIMILVHELMHLYSSNNNFVLPQAFDEGMTDYFSTKAMGYNELDMVRASGYPIEVQVVMALLEKIPENKLLELYFSKNESSFKKLMTEYFPDVKYEVFMTKYKEMFDVTFHLKGSYHDFNKALIDHDDIQGIRLMLGLEKYKFSVSY